MYGVFVCSYELGVCSLSVTVREKQKQMDVCFPFHFTPYTLHWIADLLTDAPEALVTAIVTVTHGFNHLVLPRFSPYFLPPVIAFLFRAGGKCALSKVLQQRAAPPIPSTSLSLTHTHTHTHSFSLSCVHVTFPLPSLAESIRLHLFPLKRTEREERERDIESNRERERW